jgi:hypothetical protein
VEYIIGVGVILFFAYKLIVRANNRDIERGRRYLNLAHVDGTKFLARPASSLATLDEIAAFNYLVMRPWRETPNHFNRYLKMFRERDQVVDCEAKEFMDLMLDEVGCTERFVVLCTLAPLPARVADIAVQHFSEWTAAHKKELEAVPDMSVGYFMTVSSRAAVAALFDTGPARIQ